MNYDDAGMASGDGGAMGVVVTFGAILLLLFVLWLVLRRRGSTTQPGERSADPGGNRNIPGDHG
jgi:hypothetical protein